ncbi:MAG: HEAT repeat domain-containing protein [Planctomycetota bacterium]
MKEFVALNPARPNLALARTQVTAYNYSMEKSGEISNSEAVGELCGKIKLDSRNAALYLKLATEFERTGRKTCADFNIVHHPLENCDGFCCAHWAYAKARVHAPSDESVLAALSGFRHPDRHEEGRKEALAELDSENPHIRMGAAYYLGLVGDEADLPRLIEYLDFDEPYLACGAIRAMGNFGAAQAIRPLTEIVEEDVFEIPVSSPLIVYELAKEAVYALGGIADESAEEVVVESLLGPASGAAIRTLRIMRGGKCLPRLLELMRASNHGEYHDIVWTAYLLDPEAAREKAIEHVKGPMGNEQLGGAEALQAIGRTEDFPLLLPLLDESIRVAKDAVIAIGVTKHPEARETLEKLLSHSDFEIYSQAFRALGVLGDPAALTAMEKHMWRARGISLADRLHALARAGGAEAVDYILPFIEKEEPDARAAALQALAETGDESMLPKIWDALEDGSQLVRDNAAEVLGVFDSFESGDRIIRAWPSLSDGGWGRAAMTLAKLGAADSVPLMYDVLKNERAWVRVRAVIAVGALAGKDDAQQAIIRLKELYADKKEHIAFRARQAVCRIEERSGSG